MSDHVTIDTVYGEYRTSVLHTDVLITDPNEQHPTEWFVYRGSMELETGWGRTPKEADNMAKQALDRIRAANPNANNQA